MRKLWRFSILVLLGLALPVLTFLVFMSLALFTLEAKYDALSDGQTLEETDQVMGFLFRARMINWGDIPEIYTGHYVERSGTVARDYRFLGVSSLNIVVVYDGEGLSYLHIPIYE